MNPSSANESPTSELAAFLRVLSEWVGRIDRQEGRKPYSAERGPRGTLAFDLVGYGTKGLDPAGLNDLAACSTVIIEHATALGFEPPDLSRWTRARCPVPAAPTAQQQPPGSAGATGTTRATKPKRPNPPKLHATQVLGQAKRRQLQDDATGAKFTDGGWGKVPNLVGELLPCMSGPVAKAYLTACLLADKHGQFRISFLGLARWLGRGRNGKRHHHPERVMRRLIEAGLVIQESRGGPGKSNTYRLLSLKKLDLDQAGAILARPLASGGRSFATS